MSITYLAFEKYLKRRDYENEVCQLFIDFEKAYDSLKRYILIKFGVEYAIRNVQESS